MPPIDYEAIFEEAEVGIALNDPQTGTIGPVNARYAEMMGYDREALESMRVEEISAEDPSFDQEAAMSEIARALDGEVRRFDWLFERKDGSNFWGEVVLKRAEIGDSKRLLVFVRDVSTRKQYERELEERNARLDEFASLVSHDLRNPLSVATGRLELAADECDSEHLEAVARAHDRMGDLIEDLLDLARSGETLGETERVELPAIVESAWEGVEAAEARLDVETRRSVEADPDRLRQLLENLLRNAVEHAGPDVTVRVGELEDGFYVEDDGPGIPRPERGRVFEAGYSTADGGTGFGLNIVQDIAYAHGWSVEVTEGEAGGARLEFTGLGRAS